MNNIIIVTNALMTADVNIKTLVIYIIATAGIMKMRYKMKNKMVDKNSVYLYNFITI